MASRIVVAADNVFKFVGIMNLQHTLMLWSCGRGRLPMYEFEHRESVRSGVKPEAMGGMWMGVRIR